MRELRQGDVFSWKAASSKHGEWLADECKKGRREIVILRIAIISNVADYICIRDFKFL